MDDDCPFVASVGVPLDKPDSNSIRVETWVVAEDSVREVLNCTHPTLDSEEKMKDVIEYMQKLISCNLQLEVFPYGSVPLKTYLPDGDIDLTVLSTPNLDDLLPSEVLRVPQEEEKNGNSEFEIKDTQLIDAEVDRLASKDNLFKCSIILIKAWCYYEGRILGARHGLISTYALETLVLYIFHVFHASLSGPLEVTYFCLCRQNHRLDGPVCKSSLPSLAVETLHNQVTDVLLGAEFMKSCMDMFIVPSTGAETDLQTFNLKNLNIIDPPKENNNLGRSVHKGNYFRIKSAFRYGARRLGKILQQPNINIKDEIKAFFKNMLQRYEPKYGHDATLILAANSFETSSISSCSEAYYEDDLYSRFSNGDLNDYMNDHNASPLTALNLEKEQESVGEKTSLELWIEGGSELVDGNTVCLCVDKDNNDNSSDYLSFDVKEKDATDDSIGKTEMLNLIPDLMGDYDAHIRNLLYGQGCHGYALSKTMVWASSSPPTSPYGNKNSWHLAAAAHSWAVPLQQNLASQVNANGVVTRHPEYSSGSNGNMGNVALRGTGPYIPVMDQREFIAPQERR